MPRVPVAVLRLVLGLAFGAAALVWFAHTERQHERILLSVAGRDLTRLDIAAVPLLFTGVVLVLLARLARSPGPASAATAWLVLSGLIGYVAAWWLSANPLGEGRLIVYLGQYHGFTQSDLVVLPVLGIAAVCGGAGLLAFVRSARTPSAGVEH